MFGAAPRGTTRAATAAYSRTGLSAASSTAPGSGPRPTTDPINAAYTFSTLHGRSSGALRSIAATSSSRPPGTSARSDRTRAGTSSTCLFITV